MVTATQNGRKKTKRNGRPNTKVNDHQHKNRGTKRERITVWVKPEVYDRIVNEAVEQNRTISSTAAPLLSEVVVKSERAFEQKSTAQITLDLDQFEHIRRVAALENTSVQDCIMERMGLRLADAETPKKPAVNGTLNGHHRPVEPAPAVDAAGPNPTAAKRPRLGEDATPRHHPLGALYIEVAKMNEHAAKMLKTLRRIRCRGTDDLYYYLESNDDTVGASHAAGQSAMLEEAFDDLQSMLRSVQDEMSASYEAVMTVIENAEQNHSLRIVQ